jgi:hypothetical protein
MDQAHQIHGSAIAVVRVPYVCNDRFTFDGGDFYSYPYRCGVAENPDARSLGALNLQDKSIDDLAPFLQAWLFFGTLHTLFNGLINSNLQWVDFVEKTEDGKVFVTTKMLPMFVSVTPSIESSCVDGLLLTCCTGTSGAGQHTSLQSLWMPIMEHLW